MKFKWKKPNYLLLFLKRFLFLIFIFPFLWVLITLYIFLRLLFTLDTFQINFKKYIEDGLYHSDEDE